MATQVRTGFLNSALDDQLHKRVAGSAESLLRSIARIEALAERKQFTLTSCSLLRFDRQPSNGYGHELHVVGDRPIVETHVWQIYGTIQGRIINAVSEYRFYTHEENRSGHGEAYLNGKARSLKPEYGGVVLDDLWQDANLWQEVREAALQEAK